MESTTQPFPVVATHVAHVVQWRTPTGAWAESVQAQGGTDIRTAIAFLDRLIGSGFVCRIIERHDRVCSTAYVAAHRDHTRELRLPTRQPVAFTPARARVPLRRVS